MQVFVCVRSRWTQYGVHQITRQKKRENAITLLAGHQVRMRNKPVLSACEGFLYNTRNEEWLFYQVLFFSGLENCRTSIFFFRAPWAFALYLVCCRVHVLVGFANYGLTLTYTMQPVVTGQAPVTLEWKITSGGTQKQKMITHKAETNRTPDKINQRHNMHK